MKLKPVISIVIRGWKRLLRLLLSIENEKSFGDDLLSQGVAPQVPSALVSLTAGFGMLPGVSSPLQSPKDNFTRINF